MRSGDKNYLLVIFYHLSMVGADLGHMPSLRSLYVDENPFLNSVPVSVVALKQLGLNKWVATGVRKPSALHNISSKFSFKVFVRTSWEWPRKRMGISIHFIRSFRRNDDRMKWSYEIAMFQIFRYSVVWPRNKVKDQNIELVLRLHYQTYSFKIRMIEDGRLHDCSISDFSMSGHVTKKWDRSSKIWIVSSSLLFILCISKFIKWH